ncbi:MAG: ABC transporter ATP-binding protein [Caldicoprobacterales bacterium]|jgi:ATP-binding cassette subfamily B multidrug efflux pump|nr:ABC transporter ATP-binding protein [Clostridiales bacterium]
MKLMLTYIRRHPGMFLTALFFLSLETAADLLQPTMMSFIVDNGVKHQNTGKILEYGMIMLGITAMGALGAVMRNIYATRTSQQIGREMRLDIYRKIQTLSFENIDRLQPSSIITRITNDVTQIQNFINGSMRIMMKAPIICIGALILIIWQTPRLIPMLIIILFVSGLLIAGNMKLGYARFNRLQQRLDRLNQVSREFLSAIRVVKAFQAEKQEEEKFRDASMGLAEAGVSAMRVMAVFGPLINLTVNLGIVVLLRISETQPPGEIGKLMASVNYMTQVLFALGMVSFILNSAVRAVASSRRVAEVLEEVPAQVNQGSDYAIEGSITFRDVSFSYAKAARPAIENISFHVYAGETIGIIGPTGSGKSTLINLVPRFYDAAGGSILIDNTDVRQIDMKKLREQIAVVPQKALLFSGTVLENLRWGDEGASMEEVRKATDAACATGFIMALTDGYDTRLEQEGVNLSGGQKQRLSIARALLRKPKILILDDCTSALDAATEAEVLKRLRQEAGDMTVLLISQRISTVMRTDRILCLEDGRIQGMGTHKELLESCTAYQAIFDSQIGEEWSREPDSGIKEHAVRQIEIETDEKSDIGWTAGKTQSRKGRCGL